MSKSIHTLSDEQLIALICTELDQGLDRLDARIVDKLNGARESALQHESVARTRDEETLVQIARESLNSASPLSQEIESSLDHLRRQAIQRMDRNQSAPGLLTQFQSLWQKLLTYYWQIPAGVAASSFVILVSVSLFEPETGTENLTEQTELSLIASAEEIELYENLDFYLWLSENEATIL